MNLIKKATATDEPKEPFNSAEVNAASTAQLLVIAIIGLGLSLLIARGSFPTPFSDEYYFYNLYKNAKDGRFEVGDIINPHFGHIYLLVKSWFWLKVFYSIDWRASMFLQAAMIALSALFISRCALDKNLKTVQALVPLLSIALVLGSPRQAENLYWALQISSATMILSSIVALYFVSKFAETEKQPFAAYGFLFSFIAVLSHGGGVATFLITTFASTLASRNNYLKLAFGLIGTAIIAACAGVLVQSNAGSVAESKIGIVNVSIFFLAFYSNSIFTFSPQGDDIYSLSTGLVVALATIYVVTSTWNTKKNIFPYLLILLSLTLFCLVAFARLSGGNWQPNASRYYPFAALILVGIAMLLVDAKGDMQRRSSLLLFTVILISFVQSYYNEWKISPHRYTYSKNAHVNLCAENKKGLAFYGNLQYTDTKTLKAVFCTIDDVKFAQIKSVPILKEFGPTQTTRSSPFNVQPDGSSALWIRTENCENSCVLVFADLDIPVTANPEGTLVTAIIPRKLFDTPGDKTVFIKNKNSEKISEVANFKVL